jgi:hypothetical protein
MDKEGGDQGPDPASSEVVEAEDEVSLRKYRVLLPGPYADGDAGDDQKRVDSHGIPEEISIVYLYNNPR